MPGNAGDDEETAELARLEGALERIARAARAKAQRLQDGSGQATSSTPELAARLDALIAELRAALR